MNDNKTRSMLQRIPVILAVTAASYGLPLQSHATQQSGISTQALSRPAARSQAAVQPRVIQKR